jgi:protein phosphatase
MYGYGKVDIGVTRAINQDSVGWSNARIGVFPNLYMVADGMGGHNAGEIASKLAVDLIYRRIMEYQLPYLVGADQFLDIMVNAVQDAGAEIYRMAEGDQNLKGMGTTLTACVIAEGKGIVTHIGDSRLYVIRKSDMIQVTKDHSFVEELFLQGQISKEEARNHPNKNVLTRVLGIPENGKIDGMVFETTGIESILLCSDGLTNMVDDASIERIIRGAGFVEGRVQSLINEANHRGGHDNIAAIIIDLGR